MPKTGKVEYERRVLTVQGWIIDGVPSALIIQQILLKKWCTSDRQAERMLKAARDKWIEYESDNVLERRKLKIQQLQHLKRSLQVKYKGTPEGIRAIVAVEKEIIKLDGLAAPVKIEVSGDGGKPIQQDIKCEVVFRKYTDNAKTNV